ncbi:unnamed protein product [Gongylonema pulchrum]|uniref:Uncharacterized protein n=1 Tax=Gongylonema pulchrum TaxID=637853 RepID=A0A183ERC9_9BILA|nr:unnamed protein product [Gongylonema pulchrum]
MLKKAKKSRRSAACVSSGPNAGGAAVRAVQSEGSPSSSRVHPSMLLDTGESGVMLMHGKSTPDELHTFSASASANGGGAADGDDDDEEGDAFL